MNGVTTIVLMLLSLLICQWVVAAWQAVEGQPMYLLGATMTSCGLLVLLDTRVRRVFRDVFSRLAERFFPVLRGSRRLGTRRPHS